MLCCRASQFPKDPHRLMLRISWVPAYAGTTVVIPKASSLIKFGMTHGSAGVAPNSKSIPTHHGKFSQGILSHSQKVHGRPGQYGDGNVVIGRHRGQFH